MTFPARHISISVNRPPEQVYQFTSDPNNLPQWASGLSGSIENVDSEWVAESPMGSVKIKFASANGFGVMDHEVTLPTGETFYNPMRAIPNDDGCEVAFTLYRRPGASDKEFEDDANTIAADLKTLKTLLER